MPALVASPLHRKETYLPGTSTKLCSTISVVEKAGGTACGLLLLVPESTEYTLHTQYCTAVDAIYLTTTTVVQVGFCTFPKKVPDEKK